MGWRLKRSKIIKFCLSKLIKAARDQWKISFHKSEMRKMRKNSVPFHVRFLVIMLLHPICSPISIILYTTYSAFCLSCLYFISSIVVYHPSSNHTIHTHKILTNYHQQYRYPPKPPRNSNKIHHSFSPLLDPLSQLISKLLNANLITRLPLKPTSSPLSKGYNPNLCCVFYMDSPSMMLTTVGTPITSCKIWLTMKLL